MKSSSSDDNSFNISPQEVRFGEEYRKYYEIVQVLKALDQDRKIRNLGKVFDYEEEESFNNNRRFSVENDGYRIRFN